MMMIMVKVYCHGYGKSILSWQPTVVTPAGSTTLPLFSLHNGSVMSTNLMIMTLPLRLA